MTEFAAKGRGLIFSMAREAIFIAIMVFKGYQGCSSLHLKK
jgi:hypothetical protein